MLLVGVVVSAGQVSSYKLPDALVLGSQEPQGIDSKAGRRRSLPWSGGCAWGSGEPGVLAQEEATRTLCLFPYWAPLLLP